MNAYVCAGAGFLLAVLWFDLMHDVQVLRPKAGNGNDAVLSIARYYRRVTTDARPMNRFVALVMVGTIAALVVEIVGNDVPAWVAWVAWVSLVLAVAAIGLAAVRTVANAVRLGADVDQLTREHEALARSIGRDHVVCVVLIGALLVVQLAWAG